jgi:hypothetical protein
MLSVARESKSRRSNNTVTTDLSIIAMSLSLNCLVLGDEPEKMFTLEVEKTKNVSILKDRIKEKNSNSFGNIDSKNIELWKFDLPLDELGEEPVHINLDTCTKLSPSRLKLSSFFKGTVDDEHLHVIAKAPGTSH